MQFELRTNLESGLQVIDFNHEAIKAELAEKLEVYQGLIVSEDGIKAAKSDRADLNKLKDALKQSRIAVKKEFMRPYDAFEAKVNELIAMIEKPVLAIDTQIKAFEEAAKEEKRAALQEYYESIIESAAMSALLPFPKIFNISWLNASTSMKKAKEELLSALQTHTGNVNLIREMKLAYEQEVLSTYLSTLDMSAALRRKAQLEAQAEQVKAITPPVISAPAVVMRADPSPQPESAPSIMDFLTETDPTQRIEMSVWVTDDNKKLLEQFLNSNGIRYKMVYRTVTVDG